MPGRIVEGDIWGDRLTGAEHDRMQVVLAALRRVPWAEPLMNLIAKRGGITLDNQPHLLEARIAHELHRQGIVPEIEYKAGVGESSVDFRIPGDPEFLVEVVSLRTSDGVNEAVWRQGYYSGISLSTHNLDDPDRQMQSEEAEAVVAQGKLGRKVYANGKITKFPLPQEGTRHVILADLRGHLGGGHGMKDLYGDAIELLYGFDPSMVHTMGGRKIQVRKKIPQSDGSMEPFAGLLEGQNPLDSAPHFRERIHFVHFVCEYTYDAGEILSPDASRAVPNLLLWSEDEFNATIGGYPLIELAKEGP